MLGISAAGSNIAETGRTGSGVFIHSLVAVWDENAAKDLADKIKDTDTKVVIRNGWASGTGCHAGNRNSCYSNCGYDWNSSDD